MFSCLRAPSAKKKIIDIDMLREKAFPGTKIDGSKVYVRCDEISVR